ncbi:hypothetical protein NPIL_433751 [Nephila pilipes]|uniref:Uncharacterized protein n=1 Tax=Nephila pilipes TaxID=299642 RepID=A0A8X6MB87_NEPPI|nr:hypothetical protein NPIL_433751 [Nephila pilipes]
MTPASFPPLGTVCVYLHPAYRGPTGKWYSAFLRCRLFLHSLQTSAFLHKRYTAVLRNGVNIFSLNDYSPEESAKTMAVKESSASSDIYKPLRGLFQSREGRSLIDCERKPHPTSVDEVNFTALPCGFA